MGRAQWGGGGGRYLLVFWGHGGPSSGSFLADGAFGKLGAEVVRDDGARGLHVEEEGGEGAFWGIGVMLTLLALLLVRACWGGRDGVLISGWSRDGLETLEEQQRVVAELGKDRLDVETRGVFAEDQVGVTDVGGGQSPNGILERGETFNDLFAD